MSRMKQSSEWLPSMTLHGNDSKSNGSGWKNLILLAELSQFFEVVVPCIDSLVEVKLILEGKIFSHFDMVIGGASEAEAGRHCPMIRPTLQGNVTREPNIPAEMRCAAPTGGVTPIWPGICKISCKPHSRICCAVRDGRRSLGISCSMASAP